MLRPYRANPSLSWEFVTTLDYEWSIIRRRRPYQWTIWVSSNVYFGLCHSTQVTVLIPSLAVLPYTCGHAFSRHTPHYNSRRYNTIQLPGRCRAPFYFTPSPDQPQFSGRDHVAAGEYNLKRPSLSGKST